MITLDQIVDGAKFILPSTYHDDDLLIVIEDGGLFSVTVVNDPDWPNSPWDTKENMVEQLNINGARLCTD